MGLLNIRDLNMLERRIKYRRSCAYRTRGNNFRPVKTPGGKLVLHLIKKHTRGTGMQGVKVARAYGGVLTGTEVKDRIMRAFLIEEFKRFKNISKTSSDKKDKSKKKKGDKKKATKK